MRGFDQFMNVVLDKAHDDKLDVELGMVVCASKLSRHTALSISQRLHATVLHAMDCAPAYSTSLLTA